MKKMSLRLTTLSLVFLFLSCSKDDTLRGSGNIITEIREVTSFTKIYNPTSVNILVAESSTQQVELSADDNVISSIKTLVENGTLKIDLTKSNYVNTTITVSVSIPNLGELKNTGSGNMTVSDFDGLNNMSIDNESSGSISISGSVTSLNLKNSGSGSYQGFNFIVEDCIVANSGSGNCEINCTEALSGSNSGSGSVFYKGNPSVDITNTGSGQVIDSN